MPTNDSRDKRPCQESSAALANQKGQRLRANSLTHGRSLAHCPVIDKLRIYHLRKTLSIYNEYSCYR